MNRLGTESAFDVLAKAKRLEAQGRQIIHLEIGQPDFQTPIHICEAVPSDERWVYGYGPAVTRAAWSDRWACLTTRGIDISPDEVVVTPGAKPIIFFTLLALVDEGDEVIYPDPGFMNLSSTSLAQKEFPYLYEKTLFSLSYWRFGWCSFWADTVINFIPPKSNGWILGEDDLEVIADLANKYDFYVLSDEIYSRILYEGKHESIIQLPRMKARTTGRWSFKTYSMTGGD